MTGEISRLLAVVTLAFRGSLRGPRLVGLGAFALAPSLLLLALVSARVPAASLRLAAEELLGVLTLPVIVMVVVLVLAVAQFRNEIDAETLVYLSDRSVGRTTVVLGKYLGAWAASLVLAVPAALLPLGIAEAAGAAPYPVSVPGAVAATAVLATAAYVGLFLLLGLVSRSALILGLLFGFLWEELLVHLPGVVPRLTLVYYLRSFLSSTLSSGPLAGYPSAVSGAASVAVILSVTLASLLLAAVAFRVLETAPVRDSS